MKVPDVAAEVEVSSKRRKTAPQLKMLLIKGASGERRR